MSLHVAGHNGIYLHAIIEQGHTTLSIDPHLGYILNPMPPLDRIRIQEGSMCALLYVLGAPSGDVIDMVTFIWGAQAPFFGAVPSFWFKCESGLDAFTNGQSWMKWSKLLQ